MAAQTAMGNVAAHEAAVVQVGWRQPPRTIPRKAVKVVAPVDVAPQDAWEGIVSAVVAARTAMGGITTREAAGGGGRECSGGLPPRTRPRGIRGGHRSQEACERIVSAVVAARTGGVTTREAAGGGRGYSGVYRRGRGHAVFAEVVPPLLQLSSDLSVSNTHVTIAHVWLASKGRCALSHHFFCLINSYQTL